MGERERRIALEELLVSDDTAFEGRFKADGSGRITVAADDVLAVCEWWRSAHEAPGGCSYKEALDGMKDAVFRLAYTLREQGHRV